jgi:HEAT repeat protein
MLSLMGPDAKDAARPMIRRIEEMFDDTRAVVWAVYGLGAIGPAAKEAVPVLIKVLEKEWGVPNSKWKYCPSGWAAWALGRIGPDAKAAVPALGRAMFGKDTWARPQAAWALSQIGKEAEGALDGLSKAITRGKYSMQCHVRDSLVNIGEPAVPVLTKAIETGKTVPAAEAAGMLGKTAGPALPALISMAGASDPKARAAALEAVCRISADAEDAKNVLVKGLNDTAMCVRHRTATALGEAGKHAASFADVLGKALSDKAPEVIGAAAKALGKIGPDGTAPLIRGLTESDDPWTRTVCARALGRITPVAGNAVTPLVKALKDKSRDVRREAVLALGRMGAAAKSAAGTLREAADDSDYIVAYAAQEALKRVSGPIK